MHGTDGEPPQAPSTGARPPRRRPRPALIAAPAPGGPGQSPTTAPAPLTWTAAPAPLPTDAAVVSGQYLLLGDVSCSGVGSCVAAGGDRVSGGSYRGVVETLSDGDWEPEAIPAVSSEKGVAMLNGVSCPARGTCVAVGFFSSATAAFVPAIETLSGGTWTAAKAPLPADAVTGSGQADATYLELAACPAAGNCLIVGSYPAADGTQGLIETAVPGHG
jgi:hypothetical protein